MDGLDLFSGIGGITRALNGYVQPVAYCEIDPYARAVLLSRMSSGDLPVAPIWDDVRTLHPREAGLPNIDILYGGFPCQDISVAGCGAGLEGERSGLFFEIVRLVKEASPRFVFLENVPAIRRRGLDRVLEELTACGYDCRWGMLSASDVGANHKRERWFLLAHAQGDGCRPWGTEREGQQRHSSSINAGSDVADATSQQDRRIRESELQPNTGTGGGVAHAHDSGLRISLPGRSPSEPGTGALEGQVTWWSVEPNVGRVAYGVPFRVDRLRALGNAVVPSQAREAFERLIGLKPV